LTPPFGVALFAVIRGERIRFNELVRACPPF
jgi:TRAP-type C4-dicarboxylate transport system permease large subunit